MTTEDHFYEVPVLTECTVLDDDERKDLHVLKIEELKTPQTPNGIANAVILSGEDKGKVTFLSGNRMVSFNLMVPSGS